MSNLLTKKLDEPAAQVSRRQGSRPGRVSQDATPFYGTVGIECAVWPHLYWKTSICKIYIRSQDMRRLQRADKPDEDESSDEDDENPVCAECRQSAKTSQGFMVWVLAVLVVLV